ncbi:MAG: pyridoxamine 5'-phosphate oxidase family protein [Planctomycetia bacterium]|nr:pyridoxamine 5'-phosphate oxidase family protein [Planctomycetia bacterium]
MRREEIRSKIFEQFDGPTLSQLATVNQYGRPWVRYVMSTIDEEMTLRIPTRSDTRKVQDIRYNPEVHVLVGKDLFSRSGAYAQIEGVATLTNDAHQRTQYWNSGMQRYFSSTEDPSYILIEVRPFRIEYWSAMEEENPAVLEINSFENGDIDYEEQYWRSEKSVVV